MPKINVYLPDELAEAVRAANLPVSAICQRALEQAVRRMAAVREVTTGNLSSERLAVLLPRFTDRARAVLTLATETARAQRSSELGTRHLLAGVLAEGGNLALQVLGALEIEPEPLTQDLAAAVTGRDHSAAAEVSPDALQLTTTATSALELMVIEATMSGHNYLGCEHLLLGLVAEPDGTAGQVLRARGAEPRLTRRAVAAALAGFQRAQSIQKSQSIPVVLSSDPSPALAALLREHLEPLARRVERLEQAQPA